MIIWGFTTPKNFGPVRKIQCNNCNSETNWFLEKITSWLMLLFIPLVPYKTRYLLKCPECKNCLELQKEEFEELREIIKSSESDRSWDACARVNSIVNGAGGVIRTQTQLNFIRDIQEFQRERERRSEK